MFHNYEILQLIELHSNQPRIQPSMLTSPEIREIFLYRYKSLARISLLTLKRCLEGLCNRLSVRLSVWMDGCHASTAALAKPYVQRK